MDDSSFKKCPSQQKDIFVQSFLDMEFLDDVTTDYDKMKRRYRVLQSLWRIASK